MDGPGPRAKAHEKIKTLRVSVGYPDTWRDYSTLAIKPDDALGNHLRAENFEYDHQKAKIGQPVDRGEWWMTPQTVNAVNLPLQNALNFPAAILRRAVLRSRRPTPPPTTARSAPSSATRSATASTTLGAEFDAQGKLANWWTPADLKHFKAAEPASWSNSSTSTKPLPGLHVSGEQTLGENIADISGLTAAWPPTTSRSTASRHR